MSKKGLTLVELLIAIVIISIISSFTIVAVQRYITTAKESSFVNTGNAMMDAAESAKFQSDEISNDNIITLQELVDNEYIDISEDPWGLPFNTTDSVISITDGATTSYKLTLVSDTASIGLYEALEDFDASDIVYINADVGGIEGIIESITGNLTSNLSGDNDNDTFNIDQDVSTNGNIVTFGGNDTVIIGRDITGRGSVDTGDGDDVVTIERWLRGRGTVDAGSGNDTVTTAEIRYLTVLDAGDGNDTVTIDSVTNNFSGSVIMGDGDDTLTVSDSGVPFNKVTGSFSGGPGDDVLNLPTVNSARWDIISHLFTGFETINLTDTVIHN